MDGLLTLLFGILIWTRTQEVGTQKVVGVILIVLGVLLYFFGARVGLTLK